MSETTEPLFWIEDEPKVTVVHVEPKEIRHPPIAVALGDQLRQLVELENRTRLILDFHKTRYMCSTAFAVLFTTARMVEGKNGRLALCGLSPDVLVGARIIGLERAAPIFDDVATARSAF